MWWRVILIIYAILAVAIFIFSMGVVVGIFDAAMEEQNEIENNEINNDQK